MEGINTCPNCGLELLGGNVVCACNAAFSTGSTSAEDADKVVGVTINATYKIEEVVGTGSMACVYRAADLLMPKTVAIKMLHPHVAKDMAKIQRFQQEARALSANNHPNVVSAYDFGVSEAGQPYLVMELLQGKVLSEVIAQANGLEYARAMHILVQACDALSVAHTKGIIHRNLKPGKIMLVQHKNDPDFVKVFGFGLAKLLPHSGKQSQSLTQTGELSGSPLYMSPEQFQGKAADARTDIYAMGCVMYEVLSGSPPFSGEHLLELMHKHIHEIPAQFSIIQPHRKIPANLETICQRALEKEPEARFQTMAEFRDAILLAIGNSRDIRGLGPRLQSIRSQLRPANKKNQSWQEKVRKAFFYLAGIYAIASGVIYVCQGDRDTQWVNLRRSAQEFYKRGELSKAAEQFFKSSKVAKELYGDQDPKYLDSLEKLAWICEEQGQWAKARLLFKKVKGLTPEDMMRFKEAQVLAYTPVSQMRELEKHYKGNGQETALQAGIAELEKYIGPTDPGLIVLYRALAEVYEYHQQFAKAETARIKLLSIREDSQGVDSIGAADAHVDLAVLYMNWGKYLISKSDHNEAQSTIAKAKGNFEAAKKLYQEMLGPNDPKVSSLRLGLAACKELARQEQAIPTRL